MTDGRDGSYSDSPNESADGSDPEQLPQLTYIDYREFRRLLRMLDVQQHLNLSAHLYSAFLISKLTGGEQPHLEWAAWPIENAPVPPQIMDDFPDQAPGEVSLSKVHQLRNHPAEPFPAPPSPDMDAPQVLLRASEEVLRRIVHRRIYNETAFDIEPVLEPEPQLGGALSQAIVSTVDKYVHRVPAESRRQGLVSWDQLGIQGPARKRLKRLFDRDLSHYEQVYASGSSSSESGSEADDSGEESADEVPSDTVHNRHYGRSLRGVEHRDVSAEENAGDESGHSDANVEESTGQSSEESESIEGGSDEEGRGARSD